LRNIKNNANIGSDKAFHKTFRELIFSLTNEQLHIIAQNLNKDEFKREKEFINNIPNQMILTIFDKLKTIIFFLTQ
jgi:hypothetical protein